MTGVHCHPMMVRDRWLLAAALGMGLVLPAAPARGQQPRPSPTQKAARRAKVVQPDQGPAPDQAVAPDVSSQLPAGQQEQFPDPPPPAEPPPAPVTEPVTESPASTTTEPPAAEPAPSAAPATPLQIVQAPPPPPPAPPEVPAKTPEGRRLQKETATLLQLAQDLKAEIEKAGGNTLSLVALRKADQIQKMSKDLKQEMSQQEQGTAGK